MVVGDRIDIAIDIEAIRQAATQVVQRITSAAERRSHHVCDCGSDRKAGVLVTEGLLRERGMPRLR